MNYADIKATGASTINLGSGIKKNDNKPIENIKNKLYDASKFYSRYYANNINANAGGSSKIEFGAIHKKGIFKASGASKIFATKCIDTIIDHDATGVSKIKIDQI